MAGSSCDVTIILPPMWSTGVPWTAPAYIVEALKARGCRVQFLDYNIRLYRLCEKLGYGYLWDDAASYGAWDRGELNYLVHLIDIDEIQGGVIGLSTTGTNMGCSLALAERIRAELPNRKIIFGGHRVYSCDEVESVPVSAADAICKGEGEEVICEVMERGFERLNEIAGLYLPNGNRWRLTQERPVPASLDSLAWPRYEEIDFDQYGKPYLGLVGSRGCIGRCIFCTERLRLPGYRVRSANNQVDELEYLSARFPIEHFPYYDACFNANYRVLTEKANEIIRRGLRVDYSGNLKIRDNMPDELFPLLRKSGFSVAFIGLESGSATTLEAMRKGHSPAMAAEFMRKCHNAGMRIEVNIIVGFPTETETHFQETLDFLRENRANIDAIISLNTFGMGAPDIWDMRDSFGIVIDNHKDIMHQWHTNTHENTLDVRVRRLSEILRLIEDLGLRGECLISDDYRFKRHSPPDPKTFLQTYAAHVMSLGADEQAGSLAAADRLRRIARRQEPTPAQLVHRTVTSLRDRGLRQTIRRGCEWLQIHSKRHS